MAGFVKRINVYDAFIEGAKEGFKTAVMIIPYLVAILVAIGIFRASGAMDYIVEGFATVFGWLGIDTEFVGALPTALMKSLSGSGSRGMMVDAMSAYGVDSFVGRVACTVQGSTDTTFYILAVYFGSVGVRKTRYAGRLRFAGRCDRGYFGYYGFLFLLQVILIRRIALSLQSMRKWVRTSYNRGFGLRSCALRVFYKIKEIKSWL